MHDLSYTEWRKLYEEAVSETDKKALVGRIRAAKAAVVSRMKEIRITSETRAEATALESALRSLIALGYDQVKVRKSVKAPDQSSPVDSQSD